MPGLLGVSDPYQALPSAKVNQSFLIIDEGIPRNVSLSELKAIYLQRMAWWPYDLP